MLNIFQRKPHAVFYRTPEGQVFNLYTDMLEEEHLLIGGAPGAGKSFMLNGLITTIIATHSPAKAQLILVDPKQVELAEYKYLPHTLHYGYDPSSIAAALGYAVRTMDSRLSDMASRGRRKWDGSRLYVVIDELMDVMTGDNKKACYPLLQKIAALGRAAGVTLLAATQCPLSTVLPTPFKACFPNRVALRTATAQDSRNICQQAGAERFPNPRTAGEALCYYRRGADIDLYRVPVYDQARHDYLVRYWLSDACRVSA